MKRTLLLILLALVPVSVAVVRTTGQGTRSAPGVVAEGWEYLVLARPGSTNFEATGNSEMRKQEGSFGHEGFVLETQLDKVGRNGWELVSVSGLPADPVYYFKRRVATRK